MGMRSLFRYLIPTLWKVCWYEKLVLLLIPTLWKVWGYQKLVLLLIPTLWKVYGYGKLVLLLIPKLWKTEGITRKLYIPECLRQAFVRSTATLRYEPYTQFINVSQKTLHIYWRPSAMSHAIHKIVSKRRCQSHFSSWRSPHHGISKDSDLCASAQRCLYYAYARLCFRNSQFI